MFEGNQFAVGGILAVAFGAILAVLRNIPGHIFRWILNKVTIELEILDRDEAFVWIGMWLSSHPDILKTRSLSVLTRLSQDENEKYSVNLVPAPGIHLIRAFGVRMLVTKTREEPKGLSAQRSESIHFRIFSRDREIATRLIGEAKSVALSPRRGYTNIYLPRWGGWSFAGSMRTRDLGSLVLENKDSIVADIKRFYALETQYVERGIPFQRGYLLYGPPGNGKTSFVRVLAGLFGLSVYMIDLRDPRMSDLDLQWLLASIPRRGLLLLEDVDQVILRKSPHVKPTDTKADEPKSEDTGITLSGLLNALDGIVSGDSGRLVFMTTNCLESLPDNLIRPGRIDVQIHFPNVNRDTLVASIGAFFPKPILPDAIRVPDGLSFASLQDLLMTSENINDFLKKLEESSNV